MKTSEALRRQAQAIRENVAYDTKWGTNFPQYTQDAPLRKARELEAEADRLDGKKAT